MKRSLYVCAAALCLGASGCLERYLTIESEPAGARVMLDGKYVGHTPIERMPCPHTGQRRFVLEKEGYKRCETVEDISGPWWFEFPFDFVTELLVPYTFKVERRVSLKLEPEGRVDPNELLKRAEALRRKARRAPAIKREPLTLGETAVATLEAAAIVGAVVLIAVP